MREKKLKSRQFELQKANEREFKLQEIERKAQLSQQQSKILKKDHIARSMSLVPKFENREVDKYFLRFGKVAKSMD